MKWIFWGAVVAAGYTYLGYPVWLWIRSRWWPNPVRSAPFFPFISIVMVVRNEASVLERKLRNLVGLNYLPDLREIVVVSDGSTDSTNSILSEFAKVSNAQIIVKQLSRGKADGLNDALNIVRGEIVVFTDARQQIESDAVRLLMENFADPSVGCASGELMLGEPKSGEKAKGTGLYWKIEKEMREMEAISGSTVGATGAIYAVRRNLIAQLPAGTILDDVYIPMHVVQQGARVVFDARVHAWDTPDGRLRDPMAIRPFLPSTAASGPKLRAKLIPQAPMTTRPFPM